ncbi:MAG: oxidoreductase [Candidatus Hydrogenedentota bacterium]
MGSKIVTGKGNSVKAGIVGCGNICDIYFKAGKTFPILEIVACADLVKERAKAKAREHGIPKSLSVDKLMADAEIELVINLTVPAVHGEVALQALQSGKHVYNEKPLCATREEAVHMLKYAKERNLRIGCAPDTFLGASLQTCRKIIDEGWIGNPVAVTAFMMHHGHETWHPDPEFYYKPGGGPMFDMGPYYLTALINFFGPIAKASAMTRTTFPERIVTSNERFGQRVKVETPTHLACTLTFTNSVIATLITSFDVWGHRLPHMEIYGTEGTLQVPDPNNFSGTIQYQRRGEGEWREVPLLFGYSENSRGVGTADLAHSLRSGRAHRANGDMAFHVLDVMHAFLDSAERARHITIHSTCERPQALPLALDEGELDP